jgi:hypothetical protein
MDGKPTAKEIAELAGQQASSDEFSDVHSEEQTFDAAPSAAPAAAATKSHSGEGANDDDVPAASKAGVALAETGSNDAEDSASAGDVEQEPAAPSKGVMRPTPETVVVDTEMSTTALEEEVCRPDQPEEVARGAYATIDETAAPPPPLGAARISTSGSIVKAVPPTSLSTSETPPGAYRHAPGSEPVLIQPQTSRQASLDRANLEAAMTAARQTETVLREGAGDAVAAPPSVELSSSESLCEEPAAAAAAAAAGAATIVSAVKVDEDDMEAQVRDRLIRQASQAVVVKEGGGRSRWIAAASLAAVALVLGLSLGLTLPDDGESSEDKESAEDFSRSTLERVRERGFVRCGMVVALPGFSVGNITTGQLVGLNVDQVSSGGSRKLISCFLSFFS